MVEVKTSNKSSNPFYGLRNCLKLFQESVSNKIDTGLLDWAWVEVKDSKKKRELFFSLLFSIGDITNRQHNIFNGVTKDNGGNANRNGFYTIFHWMRYNCRAQFVKFLEAGLFNEYTCFDVLFKNRVRTQGGKILEIFNLLGDAWYQESLAYYIYKVINGSNPFNKMLVAKFLTLPRLSKRKGHKKMLQQTRQNMEMKCQFLSRLSDLMGWEYTYRGNIANFKGYRQWRKQYNGNLESVLFSTGKIKEFDKVQFLDWLDKLPAGARNRVHRRISACIEGQGLKWPELYAWYQEWDSFKSQKQAEQRDLEEKVRQGQADHEDLVKLEEVKKKAKVNTGAVNFKDLYESILNNRVDELALESFIQNKVNLPYNSLVIIDDSGSMTGEPFNFAKFLASVCLVKNPDDDARNLIGFFNTRTHWHSYINYQSEETPNWFIRTAAKSVEPHPFVDPSKSFMDNYRKISSFCNAVFQGGCTNIASIADSLRNIAENNPALLDSLKQYPVWTIISDGEWNNLHSPEASINEFLFKCERELGFKPFIVAIDVCNNNRVSADRFSGIENMIYVPANPAAIEMFLTNFKNMETYDVYMPLNSLYKSNRYSLVRENTL